MVLFCCGSCYHFQDYDFFSSIAPETMLYREFLFFKIDIIK